jgi:hypothetical protein
MEKLDWKKRSSGEPPEDCVIGGADNPPMNTKKGDVAVMVVVLINTVTEKKVGRKSGMIQIPIDFRKSA